MEALNLRLFDWINATGHAPRVTLEFAHALAVYAIYLVPLLLLLGWLHRDSERQRLALRALVACGLALAASGAIGLIWNHPRPFMMPVGQTYLAHAANPSFPSDHMTVISTVAATLLLCRGSRRLGAILAVLGVGIAWSRVYLGVHFPMDMLGAIGVSALAAGLATATDRYYMPWLYALCRAIYRRLCAPLINRGWLAR